MARSSGGFPAPHNTEALSAELLSRARANDREGFRVAFVRAGLEAKR